MGCKSQWKEQIKLEKAMLQMWGAKQTLVSMPMSEAWHTSTFVAINSWRVLAAPEGCDFWSIDKKRGSRVGITATLSTGEVEVGKLAKAS